MSVTEVKAPPHRLIDDVIGMVAGTSVVALGLTILKAGGVVTGGTAGFSLLLGYVLPVPTGVLFFVVNLPFLVFAIRGKGWLFTIRSGLAIILVSALVAVQPLVLTIGSVIPAYAALLGNTLSGVGVLILFRHRSSLGGFNIIALYLQERFHLRAGYVLMALDALVVLSSLSVVGPLLVLISAGGVVILNLILAVNHRPGRYLGA